MAKKEQKKLMDKVEDMLHDIFDNMDTMSMEALVKKQTMAKIATDFLNVKSKTPDAGAGSMFKGADDDEGDGV